MASDPGSGRVEERPEVKQQPAEWVSRKEAAQILGMTRSAIGVLVTNGKLRAKDVAGEKYIHRADVENYKRELRSKR